MYHSHSALGRPALGRPFELPEAAERAIEDQPALTPPLIAARRVHVAQLWQDVLAVLGTQAMPVCILSLGWMVSAAMLVVVKHLRVEAFDLAVLVVGAFGLIGSAFTRGVITWMALQTSVGMRSSSFSAACRASLVRLPALLFGSLGYAALIVLGATGFNVWLRHMQLDSAMLIIPPRPPTTAEHVGRTIAASGVDAFLPNPWAPLPDVFPRLRSHAYAATVDADLLRRLRSNALKGAVSGVVNRTYTTSTLEFWLVGLSGLAIMLAGETLLRFYAVMAMAQPSAPRLWTPLVEGARLASRHWKRVTLHVWLVRLVIAVFSIAFVVAPGILMQSTITPKLAQMAFAPWLPAVCSVCTALIAAGVAAFFMVLSAVYDARLAVHLDARASRAVDNLKSSW